MELLLQIIGYGFIILVLGGLAWVFGKLLGSALSALMRNDY